MGNLLDSLSPSSTQKEWFSNSISRVNHSTLQQMRQLIFLLNPKFVIGKKIKRWYFENSCLSFYAYWWWA